MLPFFPSGGRFDGRPDWLRIENTRLSPADAAERIIARFGLPTRPLETP